MSALTRGSSRPGTSPVLTSASRCAASKPCMPVLSADRASRCRRPPWWWWMNATMHGPGRGAKSWRPCPMPKIIGLSATPARGDGRGLGGIFDRIIDSPQNADLIALGYLVPTRVFAPHDPDLKGVQTKAGDYVESQLAER